MDAISIYDCGLRIASTKFKHNPAIFFLAPVTHFIVLWADQIKTVQENLAPAGS